MAHFLPQMTGLSPAELSSVVHSSPLTSLPAVNRDVPAREYPQLAELGHIESEENERMPRRWTGRRKVVVVRRCCRRMTESPKMRLFGLSMSLMLATVKICEIAVQLLRAAS